MSDNSRRDDLFLTVCLFIVLLSLIGLIENTLSVLSTDEDEVFVRSIYINGAVSNGIGIAVAGFVMILIYSKPQFTSESNLEVRKETTQIPENVYRQLMEKYQQMKLKDLSEECKKRGIKFQYWTSSEKVLINLLVKHDFEER